MYQIKDPSEVYFSYYIGKMQIDIQGFQLKKKQIKN